MSELIRPIKVSFDGKEADYHRMDAVHLGASLQDIAKVYNSIGHMHFHLEMKQSHHSHVRVQVGPPERGSLFYFVYLMLLHGELAVFPELYFEAAEICVPELFKALIAKKTGQQALLEKSLELIDRQQHNYAQLAEKMHEDHVNTQSRMMDQQDTLLRLVDKLATNNNKALSEVAAPVGKSVDEVKQIPNNSEPIVIDAAIAEALRSPEEMKVGDVKTYFGVFAMIDKTSGRFKFVEKESGETLKGQITDPAVSIPENIYTHALDSAKLLEVTAKPLLKEDGSLHNIYISDARNV